jgi:hypothetical protein
LNQRAGAGLITAMNDQALKAAVSRFLKNVNFKAQNEIEKVIRNAVASGQILDGENFTTSVTVASDKLDFNVTIFSKIEFP